MSDKASLLSAIQDITNWSTAREDCPEEIREALGVIESICRHDTPVWSSDDANKI